MMTQTPTAATPLLALLATTVPAIALAVDVPLDTTDPANGLTEIYSATFDPPLNPTCVPGRLTPPECAFFGGQTPSERAISLVPTPTTVANGAPRGITPQPPEGSFLDLDLSAGNTQLTLNGGVVYIPAADIVIRQGTPDETNIQASDIGVDLKNFAPATVPVNGNGVAVIELDVAPQIGADFSTFSIIVDNCVGNLCALIPILTLDMIRFRLTIDYDATFGSFTADFKGQTANNSMVFATLNSGAPAIDTVGSVDFGDVTEMTSADELVTVSNAGNASLVLGTVVAPAAPFSIPGDNCSGRTLAPAATCTINVRFAPATTGTFSGSFQIPSNDAGNPLVTVDLSGTGTPAPQPGIAVTDSIPPATDRALPFGEVTIGTLEDETVTVTNVGAADLVLGAVGQSDGLAAPFSVENDACSLATLPPGASCNFTVRFAPDAEMLFSDSVDIPSNDPDEPSVTVTVSGGGTPALVPNLAVTNSLDPTDGLNMPFGDVAVNATRDGTITVTSSGTADLVLGAIVAPGAPFGVQADTCSGATLSPAATCTIGIRFAPVTEGAFADSVTIPSNAASGARVVQLSGSGFTPAPSIAVTNSLDPTNGLNLPFGTWSVGTLTDATVTVTNAGTADLVLGTVGQVDLPAPPFGLLNDGCSAQTLPPGADCTFDVQFAPTAPGEFSDRVDIPSNDPGGSRIVAISGTGAAAAAPAIRVTDSVKPEDDLKVPYGDIWELFTIEETITVTNNGSADLVIGTIAPPASPFEIVRDTCSGQTLTAATSCTLSVSFTAVTVDSFADRVAIPSNDPDTATVTVELSATGIPPEVGERLSTEPSGSDGGLFGASLDPYTTLALAPLIPWLRARRRHRGARDRAAH